MSTGDMWRACGSEAKADVRKMCDFWNEFQKSSIVWHNSWTNDFQKLSILKNNLCYKHTISKSITKSELHSIEIGVKKYRSFKAALTAGKVSICWILPNLVRAAL